jgi:hypothetical protein
VARVNMFVVLEIVMLIFVKMAFRHFQLRLTALSNFSPTQPLCNSLCIRSRLWTSAWKAMAAHAQTICFVV